MSDYFEINDPIADDFMIDWNEIELGPDEYDQDDDDDDVNNDDDQDEEEEEEEEDDDDDDSSYRGTQDQAQESIQGLNNQAARAYRLRARRNSPRNNVNSPEQFSDSDSDDIQMLDIGEEVTVQVQNQPSVSTISSVTAVKEETIQINDSKPCTTNDLDESSSNDAGVCTICYEPYTTSPQHRMVCLKCGHIYGKLCIEKWISTSGNKARCPECNAATKKVDIRVIYSHTVRALDTSERDQAMKQLEEEREKSCRLLEQVDELKMLIGLKESEIYLLKKELNDKEVVIESLKGNRIANSLLNAKIQTLQQKKEPFKLLEQVHIQPGGARLLATSEILGYIFVTHQSNNHLYKGFGLRRISISNLKRFDFIFLHDKMIRDIAVHPKDAVILSVGTDRQIKMTNLITSTVMYNINLEVDPWSVCWDHNHHDRFFVGLNNGKLIICCSRTGSQLRELLTPIKSPIVSLNSLNLEHANKTGLVITGMLASYYGQINSDLRTADSCARAELAVSSLNVEGRFMSTHVLENQNSGSVLLSCRPSTKNQNLHHWLLDYQVIDLPGPIQVRTKVCKQFTGGRISTLLTKSKIFPHPNDVNSAIVCCSDEDERGVLIWQKDDETLIQKLKCNAVVLDIALMKISNPPGTLLVVLTEWDLYLYSWTL